MVDFWRRGENCIDWLLYEYDAANRLHLIKVDGTTPTVVEAYYYGSSNSRLITHNNSLLITYASAGGTTLAEYTDYPLASKLWTKSYTSGRQAFRIDNVGGARW